MLSGKRIILGVTGGIAAYKAAFLLRAFQKAGAEVRVTMTTAAQRFVGKETFASLSKHSVATTIFPDDQSSQENWTRHISWGEWADLFVIAPCTANTMAKMAGGFADNMLTATVLAARCPILLCPTMDGEMYNAPAVTRNLNKLQDDGFHIMEPDSGYLASGLEGKGRLPEADQILEKTRSILTEKNAQNVQGPLAGKKVVVTAGPTREFIDPVRFISNPSSGKMGLAMADAAHRLGGDVTLIHGPITQPIPDHINSISITSAEELFQEIKKESNADVIIMAAAVADYSPQHQSDQKIKKDGNNSSLKLQRTTDILSWLGQNKGKEQILIGFAMETEELIERATEKRKKKNTNWIVANSIADEDSGFGVDTNTVTLLGEETQQKFSGSKTEVAQQVLDLIFEA